MNDRPTLARPDFPSGASSSDDLLAYPTLSSAVRPASPHIGRLVRALRFRLRASGIEAVVRLGLWIARVAAWEALGALLAPFRSPALRARQREQRRGRAVRQLAALLGVLKGAFAKAGQFAASRPDLLPRGARAELAALRDRVPALPFSEIRQAVERELGTPLERLFSHFDPAPLGAASIAQVHRALLPDGRMVAVKVQYPWLEACLRSDLWLIRRLAAVGARLRGQASPVRDDFLLEFARGLEEELDFEREARVAEEIALNLAEQPQVVVPEIVASHSRKRVLTMSYHRVLSIRDRNGLEERGIQAREVLEVLARAYAKQVFVDGLFHADPHPGNLFVLDEPDLENAGPRLLFIDFGLSKRLDPELRQAMRQGLFAILQRDASTFVERMDAMGMIAPGARESVQTAVASMFEKIAEGGAVSLAGPQVLALKDEAVALLRETPGLQLPHELLLYAKTLSYLFALGAELDPEVDLMKLSLPYLMQFLAGGTVAASAAPALPPDAAPAAG